MEFKFQIKVTLFQIQKIYHNPFEIVFNENILITSTESHFIK